MIDSIRMITDSLGRRSEFDGDWISMDDRLGDESAYDD